MWKDPVLNWTNKAPVVVDVERWEGNIAHLKGVTDGLHLEMNSRINTDPVSNYPTGMSSMRVNSDFKANMNFPELYGNLFTIRTTEITATQMFLSTGSNGSYKRQTLNGIWQPWMRLGVVSPILWEGNISTTNTEITLTQSMDDFSLLDVTVDISGIEVCTLDFKTSNGNYIKGMNVADTGTSTALGFYEMRLERVSSTKLKIAFNYHWSWNGNSTSNATINPNATGISIRKIVGRN